MPGNSKTNRSQHARSLPSRAQNPSVAGFLLVLFVIALLFTLAFASEGEDNTDTKVIFPVPGTITKCPLHVKDAVKECHSEITQGVGKTTLSSPGTYIIRIK